MDFPTLFLAKMAKTHFPYIDIYSLVAGRRRGAKYSFHHNNLYELKIIISNMPDITSVFNVSKPIIGMIHLAGDSRKEKLERALEELRIYDLEGVDGAIIEDYHGDEQDVLRTFPDCRAFYLAIGINILSNPYHSFVWAKQKKAKFIQFDSVQDTDLEIGKYNEFRRTFNEIPVLGGVGFKYTKPTGNPLRVDLIQAKHRCEVVVTTGSGTGIETPVEKLREYKRILGDFPLFVGAGVNADNAYEQLSICDGAIVGSYFKPAGDTTKPVDRNKVKQLMGIVKRLRK